MLRSSHLFSQHVFVITSSRVITSSTFITFSIVITSCLRNPLTPTKANIRREIIERGGGDRRIDKEGQARFSRFRQGTAVGCKITWQGEEGKRKRERGMWTRCNEIPRSGRKVSRQGEERKRKGTGDSSEVPCWRAKVTRQQG